MPLTYKATEVERFLTLKEAAGLLGIHYWKLQRAAKAGLIPSYNVLNSRRLVRLSEISAVIERSSSQKGDDNG